MGIFDSLFKKSAAVNKAAIVGTFESTLKNFKTATADAQVIVGKKIFADLNLIAQLTPRELPAKQQQLVQKYKDLRNLALRNGATNDRDPNYAYAALMESLVLSMGDETVATKIGKDLMNWLASINVVERA